MLYSLDELHQFSLNLENEIADAASGKKNSLAYSKNPIPKDFLVEENEEFQVLMMGGSHLESSIVKLTKGLVTIGKVHDEELPNLNSKDLVCEIFTRHLDPNVSVVSLNFAYPMQAILREGRLDGVLIAAPKQHQFIGLLGQTVGEVLEDYVLQKTGRKIKITVCNDTTALGLASLDFNPKYAPKDTMVGVVGTGYNFGFFENSEVFINLESGNFANFTQTPTAKIIDQNSTNPGKQWLEKEVGGAYLSWHYNLQAKQENLGIELNDTKQLSQLAPRLTPEGHLAKKVLKRAASLVAVQISAIYNFKKKLNNAGEDYQMLAMIEGSLYWKGYNFVEYVDYFLADLGIRKNTVKLESIDRIGVMGAAKLVRR